MNQERLSFYFSNKRDEFSFRLTRGGFNDGNTPAYEFKHADAHLALIGFEFISGTYHGATPTNGCVLAFSYYTLLVMTAIIPLYLVLRMGKKRVAGLFLDKGNRPG